MYFSPVSSRVDGLRSTFKILPELITNTTNNTITSIKADFGNGKGLQAININQTISVSFDSEGEKYIDFEIIFNDGTIAYNRASIFIRPTRIELNAFAPGDEGPITPINSTIIYQGFDETIAHIGTGEYKIYYDNVDGILDKPIIFVDGFDPNDSRTIPLMYNLLNFGSSGENLGDDVRDLGFDLVVLNFPTYTRTSDAAVINGGADYIQRNAFILIELLNTINAMKVGAEQNVVIGPSMGGLISRYALRYMEQNALTHDTRLYISFDSPHLGANVPMSIQYFFNYLANGEPGIADLGPVVEGLLNSSAAKQMLVDHYSSHLQSSSLYLQDATKTLPAGAPNFRDAFQNELDAMGFPVNVRNVSMINGSKDAATTGSPGAVVVDDVFDTTVVTSPISSNLDLELYFTPNASTTSIVTDLVFSFFGIPQWTFTAEAESPSYSAGVDSSPGGLYDLSTIDDGSFSVITDLVNAFTEQYFCFIPSVSAMSLEITNNEIEWFHDIDLGEPGENRAVIDNTPFVNWYMPVVNEKHVLVTPENVAFAMGEINQGSLSIPDIGTIGQIRLEQNPILDKLVIISDKIFNNTTISIVDITGKVVYNSIQSITKRTELDIPLSSGLYILNIDSKNFASFNTKVIVR